MERRKLSLSREVLTELRPDELRAVVGAAEAKLAAHVPVNDGNIAHTAKCLLQGCTCYCA